MLRLYKSKEIFKLFNKLGVPVAPEKVHGPLTCLEFLGITLDSVNMEARLSTEKVLKLRNDIHVFSGRKKCSKRELLSLIGSLSFACKVIVPGRPFLARLISLSCTVKKLHYKVYLNKQVREDLSSWHMFLRSWNGKNFFLDQYTVQSSDIEFYTDAASTLGYAAYFQGAWFSLSWEKDQLNFSMSEMELYPIVVAASVWGTLWAGKRILVHCDNEGTVGIINKGYSNKGSIAHLLRQLMLTSMRWNFYLRAIHIPGKINIKADLLSRFQMSKFHQVTPEADLFPTFVKNSDKP